METLPAFAALYREQVLEHARAPRRRGALPDPARRAVASNTLCGDRVALSLRLDAEGRIVELRHDTEGCVICVASASLMAGDAEGRDGAGIALRFEQLRKGISHAQAEGLDELSALLGVSAHPSRHRCALLPWEALQSALLTPESPT